MFICYCRTAKQICPAMVKLGLSDDKQALEVKAGDSSHNHPVSEVNNKGLQNNF